MAEDKYKEELEALTCLDGLKLLCKSTELNDLVKQTQLNIQQSFLKALKRGHLMYILDKLKIWCTIVLQLNDKNKQVCLLYDTHFLVSTSTPYHFLRLNSKGHLLEHSYLLTNTLAKWSVPKRFSKVKCTSTLFQDFDQVLQQNPTTTFECAQTLLDFLLVHKLQNVVQINYINTIYPHVRFSVLSKPSKLEECKLNLCLYNYKNKLYCTPFDTLWNKNEQQQEFQFQTNSTLINEDEKKLLYEKSVPLNDDKLLDSKNRNCGISIMLKGTTLAYHCGLFDNLDEWKFVVEELNKTVMLLWPHHDANLELRSLFVYCPSNQESFFCTLNIRNYNQQTKHEMMQYKSLWFFLLQQYEQMKKKRVSILDKVWKKLSTKEESANLFSGEFHLFARCFRELQNMCNNQRLLYFQREDIFLHKFKLVFTDFLHNTYKGQDRIQICADKHNVPYCLKSKHFDLENIRASITANEPLSYCPLDDTEDLTSLLSCENVNLLPYPIIPTILNWHNFKWQHVYCPGSIENHATFVYEHVANRSLQLVELLTKVYLSYSNWLANDFGLDSMNSRVTFSQLSYQCILKKTVEIGGPLYQSPEKLKSYYDCFLRQFCHGGFCYSAKTELSKHEDLFPTIENSPPIENIIELDITSSYGTAASKPDHFPGGFCMAYFNNKSHPTTVYATDTYKRFSSFEFTTVFAVILYYLQLSHTCIRTAFHNYSSFGLVKIGPYFVDLVLVLECCQTKTIKEIAFFQLDGQYAHGCDICPPLKSYVGNKTFEQLRLATTQRNEYIQNVLSKYNIPFSYNIITDCHDANFSKNKVKEFFKTKAELQHLISGYSWLPYNKEITPDMLSNVDANLTFFVICKGTIDCQNQMLAQMVSDILGGVIPCPNNVSPNDPHAFENTTCQDLLLTRAWYEFFIKHLNFKVTHVKAIFFFKTCKVIPQVYKHLIEQRQIAKQCNFNLKAELYKKLINTSCGYFGLNLNKGFTNTNKIFITNKVNKKFKILRHKFEPLGSIANDEYYIKSLPHLKNRLWQKNKTHVGIFIHIIEQGKLNLYKKLLLILSMCEPYTVRLLYSNVDNLILGLASKTSNFLDILKTEHKDNYSTILAPHLCGSNPGQLKLEWTLENVQDWSFVTPRQCVYVVNKTNITKFSSINTDTIDNKTLYTLAQNMLKRKSSTITQTRRTKKMFNLEKSVVTIELTK